MTNPKPRNSELIDRRKEYARIKNMSNEEFKELMNNIKNEEAEMIDNYTKR